MSTIANSNFFCKLVTCTLALTCFQFQLSSAKLDLSKTALIIVDVQNDFCAGGSMAIQHGDDVIPVINQLRSKLDFGTVILTKDWHPPGHVSFFDRFKNESLHPNAKLRQEYTFDLEDGLGQRSQILWPTHGVQNSIGAEIRVGLIHKETDMLILKGTNPDIDSYSGFVDNDGTSETELDAILKKRGVEELIVAGLVLEYCVGNTAKDGVARGYKVTIPEDAVRCFDPAQRLQAIAELKQSGVNIRNSADILNSQDEDEVGTFCPFCLCPTCTCSRADMESSVTQTSSSIMEADEELNATISFSNCQCHGCTCPVCS